MTLTTEAVKQATRELLEEYGTDYRYPKDGDSCTYGPTATAEGCLIGLIAKKIDIDIYNQLLGCDRLGGGNAWFNRALPTRAVWDNAEKHIGTSVLKGPKHLLIAMREAQGVQDRGHTWGEAAQYILELEEEES